MSTGRTPFGEVWFHVGDEAGATKSKAIAKFRKFDGRYFPAKTKFYARHPAEPEMIFENPAAIPARWTPATVSRKGGQIQIRMGGR
jgi:hypothetical protein